MWNVQVGQIACLPIGVTRSLSVLWNLARSNYMFTYGFLHKFFAVFDMQAGQIICSRILREFLAISDVQVGRIMVLSGKFAAELCGELVESTYYPGEWEDCELWLCKVKVLNAHVKTTKGGGVIIQPVSSIFLLLNLMYSQSTHTAIKPSAVDFQS